MRLGEIITKIRAEGTTFGNLVGGAIEMEIALKGTLQKNMAFVIPLIESASENSYDSTINQQLIERFGVIVAIANDDSQKETLGVIAYDQLHDIRGELFDALLGWEISVAESKVYYRGGRFIAVNKAYLWYQFEFEYKSRLTDDGLQTRDIDITEVPVDFDTIYANIIQAIDTRIPYSGSLPIVDGYPDVSVPDMAVIVDFTVNPDDGPFDYGFASAFDIDYNK